MHSDESLTEEELGAIVATILFLEPLKDYQVTRIREVWPKPSPWRWAPTGS